jgi:hypothetical protein
VDITYRPAKCEDLEDAERVVQEAANELRVRHGMREAHHRRRGRDAAFDRPLRDNPEVSVRLRGAMDSGRAAARDLIEAGLS